MVLNPSYQNIPSYIGIRDANKTIKKNIDGPGL